MSSILLFETSTDRASIALALDGDVVEELSFTSDRRHNALLFKPLSEIIRKYGSTDFDVVLVGSGPGSYSGTRVGIAAAQGAALIAGCKTVAVPSVLATPEAVSGGACLAVGDARRGSYWLAPIENGELVSGPDLTDVIGLESAVARAEEKGAPVICMERISGKEITVSSPSATGLWHAWQAASPRKRALWAGAIAQPIYLKPPHITPSKKEVFR